MDGRKNNGGKREGAGRKPNEVSQKLKSILALFDEQAQREFGKAINAGEPWAIKLYFQYSFGMPIQMVVNKEKKQRIQVEIIDESTEDDKIN